MVFIQFPDYFLENGDFIAVEARGMRAPAKYMSNLSGAQISARHWNMQKSLAGARPLPRPLAAAAYCVMIRIP